MDVQKSDARNLADLDLTETDMEIMNKKWFSAKDIKGALIDKSMRSPEMRGRTIKMILGLVLGFMLFVTGAFITATTWYSGFGFVAGIIFLIASVAIPYLAFSDTDEEE